MVACLKTSLILSVTVTKGHWRLSILFRSSIKNCEVLAEIMCETVWYGLTLYHTHCSSNHNDVWLPASLSGPPTFQMLCSCMCILGYWCLRVLRGVWIFEPHTVFHSVFVNCCHFLKFGHLSLVPTNTVKATKGIEETICVYNCVCVLGLWRLQTVLSSLTMDFRLWQR